ncbi:MAG: PAS domain S-box protein [Rhodopseudomonas palustris]|uniref:histidine kinase n=1 Tax=Rhodopseudomonas palustris TaxID=1076 RepID=A0A933S2Y8_RHOPL|nr:PAS domain S-box protein [Rhodopseudomonas palustris]
MTSLALNSELPMVMLWGESGVMIYNDAYAVFAGRRHPQQLGSDVLDGWPEMAPFNRNVLDVVLGEGQTLAYHDQHLVLHRKGQVEDVFADLDYSPVVDAQGKLAGVFAIVRETTERVRTEQRLRIAQEAGHVGTFEWYPETGRLDVSDEYRRIWGLGMDAIVTADLLVGLLHPDDRCIAGPSKMARENPLEYAEYRRVDPVTGEIRWIARRGEAVSTAGVAARRFVGIAYDITDIKEARRLNEASEVRWRGLFESMNEGFFVGEAVRQGTGRVTDFRFLEMNPAFEVQTGIPIQAAAGRTMREVVPGIQDELIETYAKVVYSGEPAQFEAYVPVLGRWFEVRARKIEGDRFAALFLDVTERKRVEQDLAASATRFRSLAQTMPNHVWTSKSDGHLDWFNDRVYAYAGAPPGSLDGDGWSAMVHPDDIETAAAAWAAALTASEAYEAEFRLRRHDGAYRWHIARAVPMRDASGAVESWVGTNTDIEGQKAAEARLAELAETLELRVEERTAELARTHDALRQSQKMEAIGNLTGGVAHDFNNLLQVVSGNLQLLTKDIAGNDRAERRVANALAGVSRGAKLASQLLAFGRRSALQPKVVNIGRLISGMDDMLRRALGEAIEIETVVAGGLWNTLIDPAQIENALLNLAINARDAMAGTGKLTIEAGNAFLDDAYVRGQDVAAGQYVMLAVTDTGAGMTPDVLAKVFEPFFSTKPEGKGTGLGLSMVYGFVKQSGGHIRIYSEPGSGTTVKLYLPRALENEDLVVSPDTMAADGGSETILVAEDDAEVRATVVETLRELGYRVLTAHDAASALTVIESGIAIDVLFTDVVMPGTLKSPELARKAKERLPNIVVLFTSGYTENAIVHGGRLDAGIDLLSKPYSREALALKLREMLAR